MWKKIWDRNNFITRCKTALNRIETQLDAIKKKQNAVHKYMKQDIADLLASHFDYIAYGRAEQLYLELNRAWCYEYIEQCCHCIADHLPDLSQQRECTEECKEAASTLIYAAARFGDLQELRDLRALFTQRYGTALEHYVNKRFVEKVTRKPPTRETKLQLMHDIAVEFSLPWGSISLEQQLRCPKRITSKPEDQTTLEASYDGGQRSMRTFSRQGGSQIKMGMDGCSVESKTMNANSESQSGKEEKKVVADHVHPKLPQFDELVKRIAALSNLQQ